MSKILIYHGYIIRAFTVYLKIKEIITIQTITIKFIYIIVTNEAYKQFHLLKDFFNF